MVGVWIALAIVAFAVKQFSGGQTSDSLEVPGAESQQASDMLSQEFPSKSRLSGQVVFHVDSGKLTDRQSAEAVAATLDGLRKADDVVAVSDPFDPQQQAMSADGRTAYAIVNYSVDLLTKHNLSQSHSAVGAARERGVQAELTGSMLLSQEVDGHEVFGMAIAVVVLLLAFGSVIAMAVPVITAMVALGVAFGLIALLARFATVPTSAPLLASLVGLGVGIDYALFVLTRHRENLAAGDDIETSVGRATATAGQAVLFAGLTVVVSICGLALSTLPNVTMLGYSAAIAVFVSMLVAVTLLPALLGLLGEKVERLSVRRRRDKKAVSATMAARWADHVCRRPWRYAIGSLVVLLALALPSLGIRLANPDDSSAAPGATERKAYDLLSTAFGPGFTAPFTIAVDIRSDGTRAAIDRVVDAVTKDPGIASVPPPALSPSGRIAVITGAACDRTPGRVHDRHVETAPLRGSAGGGRGHACNRPNHRAHRDVRRLVNQT